MTKEQKKYVEFYKKFIQSEEQELEFMYKEDEEYYKDDIEQKELLIKGWKAILNLIQEQEAKLKKKDKIINLMAKAFKQDDVRSVEEIKRFYERKVEDESDDKSTYGK